MNLRRKSFGMGGKKCVSRHDVWFCSHVFRQLLCVNGANSPIYKSLLSMSVVKHCDQIQGGICQEKICVDKRAQGCDLPVIGWISH